VGTSEDAIEFGEANIVGDDMGAEVGVIGGLGEGRNGMRKEGWEICLVMRDGGNLW
jgi:hypothetical protein